MARRPNFKFERMERDRLKAAKKAEKAKAKADKNETAEPEPEEEKAPDGA